jgi:putative hemolysin
MSKENHKTVIDVREILNEKAPHLSGKLPAFIINFLKRIIHQDEVNEVLAMLHGKDGVGAMNALVDYFDIRMNIHGAENLSPSGRYIFASNHPLGGLDGICLSSVIGNMFGGKVRLPVNDILLFLPHLRSIFVPVNKHGRQDRQTVDLTNEAYSSDNQIITFPAGLCSRKIHGKVTDTEWKKSFIQKALAYERSIVPVLFDGRNSQLFYNIALWRRRLRIRFNLEMLLLADELFKSKRSTYNVYFGAPIPCAAIDKSRTAAQWTEWIRERAYSLNK